MHPEGDIADRPAHPGGDLAGLRAELAEKNATIANFKDMIEQLMSMVSRYEAISPATPAQAQARAAGLTREATEKVLELLDRAIVRAEHLSRDKQALQANLDKTLSLLEDSLRNQETVSRQGRYAQAAPAGPASTPDGEAMQAALAKYDAMLERSLNALDEAYRASRNSRREIEERDRLLSRTLDALQQAVESEPSDKPRKPLLGRLFT